MLPAALELARDVAVNANPASVAYSKRLLWADLDPDAVAAEETTVHLKLMGGPDAAEGPAAWREHRPPRWRSKAGEAGDPGMTDDGPRTIAEVLDGVDLSGRTAVVTGASSGLGLQTAQALQSAGAEVLAAVRDVAKTRGAIHCEIVETDLSDLRSVRAAAAAIADRLDRIDLLINNAGVMASP